MSAALERVEASWRNLMEALAGIPDERLSEPRAIDRWSAKDVLAHIAFWSDNAVEEARRKLAGDTVDSQCNDAEAVNLRVAAERADWSARQARDALRQSHERVVALLRGRPELSLEDIGSDAREHVDEHASDIRSWRERVGL